MPSQASRSLALAFFYISIKKEARGVTLHARLEASAGIGWIGWANCKGMTRDSLTFIPPSVREIRPK